MVKIFECDCTYHGVAVNDDFEYNFIELAFWEKGQSSTTLWYRLRQAWQIIKTGTPYLDMVIFNYNQAKNFANHVLKLTEKSNGNTETKKT